MLTSSFKLPSSILKFERPFMTDRDERMRELQDELRVRLAAQRLAHLSPTDPIPMENTDLISTDPSESDVADQKLTGTTIIGQPTSD